MADTTGLNILYRGQPVPIIFDPTVNPKNTGLDNLALETYGFFVFPDGLTLATISAKARIVEKVYQCTIVSPADGSHPGALTNYFIFTIPANNSGNNTHFQIQIDDTDNTFGSIEFEKKTWEASSGFQYWDGDSWENVPQAGIDPSLYVGNQARIQVTLTSGQKFWRVRALAK